MMYQTELQATPPFTTLQLHAYEQFAKEIDSFYRQRFGYKSSCVDARFPTVAISRAALDLYLRFWTRDDNNERTIVIARVGFRKQRQGEGRALLTKLVDMAPKYGYGTVEIEQTGPHPSIQKFVRKFGFRNSFDERNWIQTVEELKAHLAEPEE